jgi:hypothetical protein
MFLGLSFKLGLRFACVWLQCLPSSLLGSKSGRRDKPIITCYDVDEFRNTHARWMIFVFSFSSAASSDCLDVMRFDDNNLTGFVFAIFYPVMRWLSKAQAEASWR